ncbi:MAG: hypothetical protein R3C70_18160 [Geminicoccaceae bacterium]
MNRSLRLFPMLALLLCACATEDPQALLEADRADCVSLGFKPESESFALCLLLQDQNRRLSYIESRLGFIELDVNRIDTFRYYRYRD